MGTAYEVHGDTISIQRSGRKPESFPFRREDGGLVVTEVNNRRVQANNAPMLASRIVNILTAAR